MQVYSSMIVSNLTWHYVYTLCISRCSYSSSELSSRRSNLRISSLVSQQLGLRHSSSPTSFNIALSCATSFSFPTLADSSSNLSCSSQAARNSVLSRSWLPVTSSLAPSVGPNNGVSRSAQISRIVVAVSATVSNHSLEGASFSRTLRLINTLNRSSHLGAQEW